MNDIEYKPLILEDFLPYRLSILSNAVSGAIASAYQERFEMSISEWRVIVVLARFPGSAAREVAERTLMDKVAVSRAVNRLIEAGRVQRHFDADDKRRSILELTADGSDVYRQVEPLALRYEERLLAGLGDSERQTLAELLGKLTRAAREL